MNSRTIWTWLGVAACLFGFIFFYQRHQHKLPSGPAKVLPNLRLDRVTSVQVRPAGTGQLRIRAERTNNVWRLTEPRPYPAQTASINRLLAFLDRLTVATYITPNEIRSRPTPDEDFGFASPQASIFLQQGAAQTQILIGARTAPGDQVFLQVVGDQGAYVVDAELLKYVPDSANEWRDTTFVNLDGLALDRIAVTNHSKASAGSDGLAVSSSTLVVQRDGTNQPWRMVWPLLQARADQFRIQDSLQKLQAMRIQQFVSDDPKVDLEALGLVPAHMELALGRGTNIVAWLQFGKSVTNDASQVYARRGEDGAVVTVPKEPLFAWRASVSDFRDPHLLALDEKVQSIEVQASDTFSIQRQTNDLWRVMPGNFPADADLVRDLLSTLSSLKITQFVKDAVNPAELPNFGLGTPCCHYLLKAGNAGSSGASSNAVIADLDFGVVTNQQDRVFVRRTDESSVYAISTNDFARLPMASLQLRERKLWRLSENDVAGLTIQQGGKVRQLIRNGPHAWAFAPGSQGVINDLAVEETVRGVIQASAASWVDRGADARARYGFAQSAYQLIFDLKGGSKVSIEFGGEAPSTNTYAAVTLDGEVWILEFPWILFRDVLSYLSVPPNS